MTDLDRIDALVATACELRALGMLVCECREPSLVDFEGLGSLISRLAASCESAAANGGARAGDQPTRAQDSDAMEPAQGRRQHGSW
jgi:hypothetical protein